MGTYPGRATALSALIAAVPDFEDAAAFLLRAGWGGDDASVVLRFAQIVPVMEAYVRGELSAMRLEDWAELIHTVEDIEFDPSDRDLIADVIYELSTPELCGPADVVVAKYLALDHVDNNPQA